MGNHYSLASDHDGTAAESHRPDLARWTSKGFTTQEAQVIADSDAPRHTAALVEEEARCEGRRPRPGRPNIHD